jgi:hypothetical protein
LFDEKIVSTVYLWLSRLGRDADGQIETEVLVLGLMTGMR